MNNAGLPGTGIGGLFYVLLAVWMPVAEINATLRGRSSRVRWRQVGTQFALACGIIAAVGGTVMTSMRVVDVPNSLGLGGPKLALAPVLLAALLLGGLVVVLRIWARIQSPPLASTGGRHVRSTPSRGRRTRGGTVGLRRASHRSRTDRRRLT